MSHPSFGASPRTTIVIVHPVPRGKAGAIVRRRGHRVAKELGYEYHSTEGKGWFAVPNLGSPFTERYAAEIREAFEVQS